MILRPNIVYLREWENGEVSITLSLNLTKLAYVGLVPVDERNQQISYSVSMEFLS